VLYILGAVVSIKAVRSQRGKGCLSSADKGGSSDVDVRTFWCRNIEYFWILWCVRTDRGEGVTVNFSRFCADLLYGWPLI